MTPYDHEVLWELLRMGIPKATLLALKEPKPTLAYKSACEFTAEGQLLKWLVLLGSVGAGKSVAAAEVCREQLAACGWNNLATGSLPCLLWLEARKLTGLSAFNSDHEVWADDLERVRLLVVDDMGDEGTEFGRSRLVGLLTARHARRRRTVLTSNLRRDAFAKRYGAALVDRIREIALTPQLGPEQSLRAVPG